MREWRGEGESGAGEGGEGVGGGGEGGDAASRWRRRRSGWRCSGEGGGRNDGGSTKQVEAMAMEARVMVDSVVEARVVVAMARATEAAAEAHEEARDSQGSEADVWAAKEREVVEAAAEGLAAEDATGGVGGSSTPTGGTPLLPLCAGHEANE